MKITDVTVKRYSASRQPRTDAGGIQIVEVHTDGGVTGMGFVNAGRDFEHQPAVINGASDLLERLFGEAGRHARSAIGLSSLPSNVSVEIELIVEVR